MQSFLEFAIKRPASKDSLGIPRIAMPQIHADDYDALFEFLKGHGITFKRIKVKPDELKAIQKEFKDAGVVKALQKAKIKKSIIISSDKFVIDGNHRWLAAMNTKDTLDAIQFNAGVVRLLALIKKFPGVTFKGLHP